MIQRFYYESDIPISGCEGEELAVGEAVKLTITDENFCEEKVVGVVDSVCFSRPYGRKYKFSYDDFQLDNKITLNSCNVIPSAYCCCDAFEDSGATVDDVKRYFGCE
jgi:hypothetical protein